MKRNEDGKEQLTGLDNYIQTICSEAQEAVYPEYDKTDDNQYGQATVDFSGREVFSYCRANNIRLNTFLNAAFSYVLNIICREDTLLYLTAGKVADHEFFPMVACHVKDMSVKDYLDKVNSQMELLTAENLSSLKKSLENAGLSGKICFGIYSDDEDSVNRTDNCNRLLSGVLINVVSYIQRDNIIVRCIYDGTKYGHTTVERLLYAFKNAALSMTGGE